MQTPKIKWVYRTFYTTTITTTTITTTRATTTITFHNQPHKILYLY